MVYDSLLEHGPNPDAFSQAEVEDWLANLEPVPADKVEYYRREVSRELEEAEQRHAARAQTIDQLVAITREQEEAAFWNTFLRDRLFASAFCMLAKLMRILPAPLDGCNGREATRHLLGAVIPVSSSVDSVSPSNFLLNECPKV